MMKRFSAAMLLVLAACKTGASGTSPTDGVFGESIVGPSNCGQPPSPDAGVVTAVVQANTTMAVQLFGQLVGASNGANVFFSPYSISTAMAMVYQGAQGTTATQMAQVLDYPALSDADLAAGYGALACQMESNGQAPDGGQIDVANAVFGQQGATFEAPFTTTLSGSFGAPFTPVDFASNLDATRQAIDAWVSQQTAGMIPQLLAPGTVTRDMKMILVDALYFNEAWAEPFDPAMMGTFHLSPQQTVQVPMMTDAILSARYYSDSSVAVVELPFVNTREAIDFVLPASGGSLASVEGSLSADELQTWFAGLTTETVLVSIPKFKIDWSGSIIPAFQALGMQLPFDPNSADFSGIDGARDLYISLLQHEAVLDVQESGVTAAAATAVGIAGSAAPEWKATFTADQPFLAIIRDIPTGTILFLAQVTNPAG
jgi:serpin B